MAGYLWLGTLAAFGLICAFWALAGLFLPRIEGALIVLPEQPEEMVLRRFRWLRGLGLLTCPIIIVTDTKDMVSPDGDVEICSPEALLSRLEQERDRFHGTGNGDSAGHRQRRSISEL